MKPVGRANCLSLTLIAKRLEAIDSFKKEPYYRSSLSRTTTAAV